MRWDLGNHWDCGDPYQSECTADGATSRAVVRNDRRGAKAPILNLTIADPKAALSALPSETVNRACAQNHPDRSLLRTESHVVCHM